MSRASGTKLARTLSYYDAAFGSMMNDIPRKTNRAEIASMLSQAEKFNETRNQLKIALSLPDVSRRRNKPLTQRQMMLLASLPVAPKSKSRRR